MAAKRNIKQTFKLVNSNYALIGLVSYTQSSRLVSSINQSLGFHFQEQENITYLLDDTHSIEFPVFVFEEEEEASLFRLVTNRTPDGYLIKDLKAFDYLLVIEGEYAQRDAPKLVKRLKQNEHVVLSALLPHEKIKNLFLS